MPGLIARPPQTVTLSVRHEPSVFYKKTRPSLLYVFHDFGTRIVANAQPVEAGTAFTLMSADVGPDLERNVKGIESLLPERHFIDSSSVCAIGAEMIGRYQNGAPCEFDITGANLLFTPPWVVWVYLDQGNSSWTFSTWPPHGDAFRPIRRVFFLAP